MLDVCVSVLHTCSPPPCSSQPGLQSPTPPQFLVPTLEVPFSGLLCFGAALDFCTFLDTAALDSLYFCFLALPLACPQLYTASSCLSSLTRGCYLKVTENIQTKVLYLEASISRHSKSRPDPFHQVKSTGFTTKLLFSLYKPTPVK